MYRRRKTNDVFSRQVSLGLGIAVDGPTSGVPVSIGGTVPILTYEGLLNSALSAPATSNFPNIVKAISVLSFSWATDYSTVTSVAGDSTEVTGAESFFVDRVVIDGAGTGYIASIDNSGSEQTYLDRDQTGSEWETISFPERTLHRRRFTSFAVNGGVFNNAASLTPGFGTERHIRRRFTLKPQQGFFWRAEMYDILVAAEGHTTTLLGDLLGVISFRIHT